MNDASQDPFPFPEKAKELGTLLRARLDRELSELRRFLGDSPERLQVLQEPSIELTDPQIWPEGGPLPQTVGEALSAVERAPEVLATATALELETCARMVIKPGLLGAVLSRPRVAEGWPWPEWWLCLERRIRAGASPSPDSWPRAQDLPEGTALEGFNQWAQERLEQFIQGLPQPLSQAVRGTMGEIEKELNTDHAPLFQRELTKALFNSEAGSGMVRILVGLTLLYETEAEVSQDLRRPAVAIDAGRHHHELVTRWRDLPKDVRRPHELSVRDGRLELLVPGQAIQLTLPLDCDDLSETMVHAIREWRGPMGLRHWAAIQRLLSIEGGRQGWVRWTLEGHLQALGYSAQWCTQLETRARVAAEVELLSRAELAVLDKHGQIRERRPLLHVGTKFDRLEGSQWTLDGMELRINPWLYRGVRDEASGKLGSNWYPAPPELAQIDHQRYQYAIALGLVLPIRFRWAWAEEGKDHLVLTGKNLLSAAGIPYDPRRPGRAWEMLERNLEELRRIQGLGRWEWDAGAQNTLSGLCRLYPADWQLDRTLHGLKPLELPPGPSVLTGDELKAWRKARSWTQAEAARQLGVSQYTISIAEAKKAGTISDNLALKVRALK